MQWLLTCPLSQGLVGGDKRQENSQPKAWPPPISWHSEWLPHGEEPKQNTLSWSILRSAGYKKKKSSLPDRKYTAKNKSIRFILIYNLNTAFSYFTYKNCCNKGRSKYGNMQVKNHEAFETTCWFPQCAPCSVSPCRGDCSPVSLENSSCWGGSPHTGCYSFW